MRTEVSHSIQTSFSLRPLADTSDQVSRAAKKPFTLSTPYYRVYLRYEPRNHCYLRERLVPSVSHDEHVTVSLTVRIAPPEKQALSNESVDTEFDAQLENLLFDGPSLPEHFSRADIYADHD